MAFEVLPAVCADCGDDYRYSTQAKHQEVRRKYCKGCSGPHIRKAEGMVKKTGYQDKADAVCEDCEADYQYLIVRAGAIAKRFCPECRRAARVKIAAQKRQQRKEQRSQEEELAKEQEEIEEQAREEINESLESFEPEEERLLPMEAAVTTKVFLEPHKTHETTFGRRERMYQIKIAMLENELGRGDIGDVYELIDREIEVVQ